MYYKHLRLETPEQRVLLLQRFYETIYRDAFPDPDQSESPDDWLPLMNDPPGKPSLHVILALENTDDIIGGAVFERYPSGWLANYTVVHPAKRRSGIATGLISERRKITGSEMLFSEAEDPTQSADASGFPWQRLRALASFGLQRIPVNYIQPALHKNTQAVAGHLLLLCCTTAPYIVTERVRRFLTDFYTVNGQADSIHLQQMLGEIADYDWLTLKSLT